MASDYLFLDEIARELRVPVTAIRQWVRDGRLPALKPGRRVLVRRKALEDFLEAARRRVTTSQPVQGEQ